MQGIGLGEVLVILVPIGALIGVYLFSRSLYRKNR
jgi:hypothetical protein